MKHFSTGVRLVVSLSLFLSAPAWAGPLVVSFDDITGIPAFGDPIAVRATFLALGIHTSYEGFAWPSVSQTQFWGVISNGDSAFNSVSAHSGTQAGWNWGGALNQEILFRAPYTVQGAYFNAFQGDQAFTADTVQFLGFDSLGNLLGGSDVLRLDKSGAHPDWQWLPFGASGVTRLEISATQTSDITPGFGLWTIDDLTLNADVSAVPEPVTISYFVVLAGAVFVRKLALRKCDG